MRIMSWYYGMNNTCTVCEASDEDMRKLLPYFINLVQKTPMFTIQIKEEQTNKFPWADFRNLSIEQKEWNEKNEMIYRVKDTERAENFKYLYTEDPRLIQWALTSNSVLFKTTLSDYQWFYDGLIPFVNYIPIRPDHEDKSEKIKWAKENDELAYQISKNA